MLAKRAAGYAKVYGATSRVSDINKLLDLPANFPASLGPVSGTPGQAFMAMPRALVWVEHYVRFADDIPANEYSPADLRKLTDTLVAVATSPRNQNVYVEAKVLQRCALVRLRIAEQDSKGDDRKVASEWFKSAISKLNPKTPNMWKWNDMFARELLNIGRIKERPKADRKVDLEEAMECANTRCKPRRARRPMTSTI